MPDITKGKTFSSGDTVTAADLNSLLDDAVINNNAVTSGKLADGAVDNAAVSGTAAIGFSKLASLSTGQVLAGNEGTPTATTLSADVTIAADGAVTIADDAVTQDKIADNAVGADQIADGAVDGAAIAMTDDEQGDILYHNGTAYARLAAGTSGQVLQTGGADANPSWVDQSTNTSVGLIEFHTGDDTDTDGTFTVPSGVTRVKVSAQGGGGAGVINTGYNSKGGGGGGAYFEKVLTVTAGDTIDWVAGEPKTYQGATIGNSTTITYDSVTYTAGAGYDGYTDGRTSGQAGTVSGTVDIAVSGLNNTSGGAAAQNYLRTFGTGGNAYDGTGTTGKAGFVKFEY